MSTATKLMRVGSAKWIPHPRRVPSSLDSLWDSTGANGRAIGGAGGRAGDTVRWANSLSHNNLGGLEWFFGTSFRNSIWPS